MLTKSSIGLDLPTSLQPISEPSFTHLLCFSPAKGAAACWCAITREEVARLSVLCWSRIWKTTCCLFFPPKFESWLQAFESETRVVSFFASIVLMFELVFEGGADRSCIYIWFILVPKQLCSALFRLNCSSSRVRSWVQVFDLSVTCFLASSRWEPTLLGRPSPREARLRRMIPFFC